MSITNENPEERFAALAETYEERLSKQAVQLPRGSGKLTQEAKLRAPVIAPTKAKNRRQTGQLNETPLVARSRWAGALTITSTQAIADSGSVWIKGQTKAGESVHIRFDGAANSLTGGTVTINGAALRADEKEGMLAAVREAVVPYGGELVVRRIQQHLAMFTERAAGYEPQD